MEPKGIFPTVTLDIDTWNQEKDQIMQQLAREGILFDSVPNLKDKVT